MNFFNPQPKEKTWRSPAYLAWIRKQPCAKCGHPGPCEAHHERYLGNGGTGLKPPDSEALPLCKSSFDREGCHNEYDRVGPETFWGGKGYSLKIKLFQACMEHLDRWRKEGCR